MPFRRIRDDATVQADEACDANGTVKDGYAVSFSMAFFDSAARPTKLTNADRSSVLARAEMNHRICTAYMGDRAPAFTDTMAKLAIGKAESDLAHLEANNAAFAAAAADRMRIEADVARAQMIENIRNAWRN